MEVHEKTVVPDGDVVGVLCSPETSIIPPYVLPGDNPSETLGNRLFRYVRHCGNRRSVDTYMDNEVLYSYNEDVVVEETQFSL